VVVEFTLNEPTDLPYTQPHRRGFEQLLRKLLRLSGAPAIIVLHHYGWWHSTGDGLNAGLFYRQAEEQLGTMAQARGGARSGAIGRRWQAGRLVLHFPRRHCGAAAGSAGRWPV
jgi:hypothetical protein